MVKKVKQFFGKMITRRHPSFSYISQKLIPYSMIANDTRSCFHTSRNVNCTNCTIGLTATSVQPKVGLCGLTLSTIVIHNFKFTDFLVYEWNTNVHPTET